MKKILHIIPYSNLYPPKNGGQLRCFHLMNELSKHSLIDLVILQDKFDFEKKGYRNNKIKIFSPDNLKKKPFFQKIIPAKFYNAIKYRIITKSISGPANSTVLEFYTIIKTLKNNKYDFVIFEHLETIKLSKIVKTLFPNAHLMLDAHNIDHILLEQEQKAFPDKITVRRIKNTKKAETTLIQYVDTVLTCSLNDKNKLTKINSPLLKSFVVPNGVDLFEKKYDSNKNKHKIKNIIFCGSLDYSPNKEGLMWFYNEVFPLILSKRSDIILFVIGIGGNDKVYNDLKKDKNVNFVGEVENVLSYYYASGLAIVPLKSGSGTRLKVLEAMSLGNPIVSTEVGAEGIEYCNGDDILIANNNEDFADGVIELLTNKNLFTRIQKSANNLIQNKYSWSLIAQKLLSTLKNQ